MKTTEITTTNISLAFKKELKKMATTYGKTQMAFLQDCIFYFKTTGMNPSNIEPYSPKDAINKLTKRVDSSISFFQKFEKDKIQPLLDQIIIANAKLSKTIEYTITKSDLTELQQTIDKIGQHQKYIGEFMKANGEYEVSNFESLKIALKNNLMEQRRTQAMLEIFFRAMASKAIGEIKPEYIDQFNEKLKL